MVYILIGGEDVWGARLRSQHLEDVAILIQSRIATSSRSSAPAPPALYSKLDTSPVYFHEKSKPNYIKRLFLPENKSRSDQDTHLLLPDSFFSPLLDDTPIELQIDQITILPVTRPIFISVSIGIDIEPAGFPPLTS